MEEEAVMNDHTEPVTVWLLKISLPDAGKIQIAQIGPNAYAILLTQYKQHVVIQLSCSICVHVQTRLRAIMWPISDQSWPPKFKKFQFFQKCQIHTLVTHLACLGRMSHSQVHSRSKLLLFSWSELKDTFRKCGKVTYTDAHQRIGSGRGEVCFDSADDLKVALKEMNGYEINGRKIEVFKTHVSKSPVVAALPFSFYALERPLCAL